MNKPLLDSDLQPLRLQTGELIKDLHELAGKMGDEALADTLSELRSTWEEPFLFVIVGEVKTGKSSFINALLATGEEVCAVAPDPCTDTIQQVAYGESARTVEVNPYFKKIFQPVDILKDISVVDTPGTNTISEHHQEITERFIPRSDLIVFVFEAKNPYRQSAWEFFDYIHADWQKKIIFVLQQADLMNEADLAVNLKGVKEYAQKKGISSPRVFALSAKQELEGKEGSGFAPLRSYILENITGRNAFRLKLESQLRTLQQMREKLLERLLRMQTQVQRDRDFRQDIHETLEEQADRSHRQVAQLIVSILEAYDHSTTKSRSELSKGLGVLTLTKKSFLSVFNKGDSPQAWLERLTQDLERDLQHNFTQRLHAGVEDIADSIHQMAKIVDLKVQQSENLLKPKQGIFGVISERRRLVLQELQAGFAEFMSRTESFVGKEIFPEASSVSPNIATGSGIAVIGVVLATVTQGMAFDITGGILSAAGLLFAGGTVLLKRGRILRGFDREIKRGRDELQLELKTKLDAYVSHIRQQIDHNFTEFDKFLEEETEHVAQIETQLQAIGSRLEELEHVQIQ